MLNVCVDVEEDILKSDPEVPVANVCVAAVKPFNDVIADVKNVVQAKPAEPFVIKAWFAEPSAIGNVKVTLAEEAPDLNPV